MSCLLCTESTTPFFKNEQHVFLKCASCNTIQRSKNSFPSAKVELERYKMHNNDINDKGYQTFVKPITNAVQKYFSSTSIGLDFGAGTGPVITKLLREQGYCMHLYDPFFYPNTDVLKRTYDFIVCCEVIEHFHNPIEEFKTLKKLLKPDGKLFCMTDPYQKGIDFSKWYYKDDPTHVLFYNQENLNFIKTKIAFKSLSIENRLIVFSC